MATILRIIKPLFSVRWRLTAINVAILAAVFWAMNFLILNTLEEYLIQQATSESTNNVEKIAVDVVPVLRTSDATALYDFTTQSSQQVGGRVIVINKQGIVQMDAFSNLNGMKLEHDEIKEVLNEGANIAYGYNYLYTDTMRANHFGDSFLGKIAQWLFGGDAHSQWVTYCAAPIIYDNSVQGAILISVSIQDVVDRINQLRWQMLIISTLITLCAMILNGAMSSRTIKPIRDLTQGIKKIGQGDFSYRLAIKGRSEFADLGNTFNAMSERLENTDRSRKEFMSNASHELKTPLTTIKILVESLIHQEVLDVDMTREFLTDVNSEVDRMTDLITDLLSISRMDESQEAVSEGKANITAIITNVTEKLSNLAMERNIELRAQIGDDISIMGNDMALGQMATNIIENAIKYTYNGGVVQVNLVKRGATVIFSVKDTGIGIAQQDIPYIFDRFYRVDKARARQTGGTGLGLSIVKKIVSQHGGTIEVNSQLGEGTEMIVTLPEKCEI